jgi:hypothetical protein
LNRRSKRLVAPSPVDRFASARARRREAAIGQRPRLWRLAPLPQPLHGPRQYHHPIPGDHRCC